MELVRLVEGRARQRERLGSLGHVGETVPCEQPPGGERRFMRGNALERDVSYEEAPYGRCRFAYPSVF